MGFRDWDGYFYWFGMDDSTSFQSTRGWRRPVGRRGQADDQGEVQDLGPGYMFAGGTTQDGNVVFLSRVDRGRVTIERLDVESGERESIGEGTQAFFLPHGFLVFFRENALWATPVDPNDGRLLGSPQIVETGIALTPNGQDSGVFSLSRSGDLVYRTDTGRRQTRPVWISRTGDDLGAAAPENGPFAFPVISPDGRFALMMMSAAAEATSLRRLDLASGAWSEPVQPGRRNGTPRWAGNDGNEWIFASKEEAGEAWNLFVAPTDGSGPAVRITSSETNQFILDISPDGRHVLHHSFAELGFWWLDRSTGESTRIEAAGFVDSASFHPSGEWIAYADASSSVGGIRVRPTRQSGQVLRLTEGQAGEVLWSPRGDEIYYRSDNHIMSIPVKIDGPNLETGRPEELFEDRFARSPFRGITNWAVHPDGRFLFFESVSPDEGGKILYVQNWVAKVESLFAGAEDGWQ